MSTKLGEVRIEASETEVLDGDPENVGVSSGREYSCACHARNACGLMALVVAAVALIFAAILAAGVFGGGETGLIAGGLTVGSMVAFSIAAVLLIPRRDNMFVA